MPAELQQAVAATKRSRIEEEVLGTQQEAVNSALCPTVNPIGNRVWAV